MRNSRSIFHDQREFRRFSDLLYEIKSSKIFKYFIGKINYIYNFYNKYRQLESSLQNYNGIDTYFANLKKDMVAVKSYYRDCKEVLDRLKDIEDSIVEQNDVIKSYQAKYGSDDNDNYRESTYQNIINNPEVLYQVTNL